MYEHMDICMYVFWSHVCVYLHVYFRRAEFVCLQTPPAAQV